MKGRIVRIAMAALFLLVVTGCNTVELHSGLSEESATEVIVTLRNSGIAARKIPNESGQEKTWTVTVGSADASDAWQVLVENDLPRERPKGFADFFGKSKLIPTETEEKALFLQALCGELAGTVEAMPSVIDARVHVSIPEKDPLRQLMEGEEPPQATAAVMVKQWKVEGNVPPEERIDEMDIKRLVASSVEGLKADHVTVITKAVKPKMVDTPRSSANGAVWFLPLAALCGVLIVLLLVLLMKNRSLTGQVSELSARNAETADGGE